MAHDESRTDTDPLGEAWRQLHARVAARFRQLNDEIRHYPSPIARCDEQLSGLIEQRDRVRTLLERMAAVDAAPDRPLAPRVRPLLVDAMSDEEIAAGMPSRLKPLAARD